MKKPLVTVVLPIYKVEKYLDRCINSVVNQSYKNLEILLIDDGSPDNCPQICDEWALKDKRIRVIHKQNEGLGMARNTGIDNATGEYICFFDSDDYIALNTIELALSVADINKSEIVTFGLSSVNSKGEVTSKFIPCSEKKIFSGDEVIKEFLPELIAPNPHKKGTTRFYLSSCVFMYSMKLIKTSNWRFVSERDIISEDVYSLLALFGNVKSVAVLPEALYYYRYNGNSLSRSYMPDRYKKIKHFYFECLKLCDELNYSDEIKHRISEPFISFTIAALKQECQSNTSFKAILIGVKEIVNDSLIQKVLTENKKDIATFSRKIMYFLILRKWYFLVFILCYLKRF